LKLSVLLGLLYFVFIMKWGRIFSYHSPNIMRVDW
jgi:hypothetical protein